MCSHSCVVLVSLPVYVTTAANGDESSYACYFDNKLGTYLGDVYSIKWMENTDQVRVWCVWCAVCVVCSVCGVCGVQCVWCVWCAVCVRGVCGVQCVWCACVCVCVHAML